MGAQNVSACYALWPSLNDAPFRLLVGMALHTLDTPSERAPARRWFAGRDALTELVRDGGRAPETRARAARAALAELVREGAVTVVVKGAPGRRAEYALNLSVLADVGGSPAHVVRPVESAPAGDVGDSPAHERRRLTRPNVGDSPAVDVGGSPAHPGTTEEPLKSYGEENTSLSVHSPARAGARGESQGISVVSQEDEERYAAARAHLARTIGTEAAGEHTAAYLVEHPDHGYRHAVATLAHQNGWEAA